MAKKGSTKRNKSFLKIIGYEKNKEFYWILMGMAVLLAALFITVSIVRGTNHFTYKTLSFTKEMFGQIPVYHYYYYFEKAGKQYQYNLYLRIDPRENNIPMEGITEFPEGKTVYVGINGTGITGCPTASRDLGTLGAFFANNLMAVKPGTMNETEAKTNNMTYVGCNQFLTNVVIQIFSGNETKIFKEGTNCYNIQIANCQTLEAIEKFEIKAILDAKARSIAESEAAKARKV